MPPSHPLELFVTVTDFHGYRRDIAIADPKLIGERAHRHVLAFRLGDGVDQFDEAPQRRARVLGADDDELPRRVPAGQPGVVPGGGREGGRRRLACAAGALPDLRARARGPARDLLHRRRRARQQAVRLRDRRDQAAGRRVRGRAAAALPRAGPRRWRAAPRREESSPSPIATVLASVSGLPRRGAGARRHPRGQQAQRARPADPGDRRDVLRPDPQADRGDRRHRARPAHPRAVAGRHRAVAHPDQRGREGGAPASPTRPTSAAR